MSAIAAERLRGSRGFAAVWFTGIAIGLTRFGELLAFGVYAAQLGMSPSAVAFLFFLRMIPVPLFGIVAGALADRTDRKRLQLGGLALLVAGSAVMSWLAWQDAIAYWHLCLSAVASGTVSSMEFPVRRTLIGDVVVPERLARAVSLDAATSNLLRALGPALAGAIYTAAGLMAVLLFGLVLHVAAFIVLAAGVPALRRATERPARSFLRTLIDGLHYVRSDSLLAAVMAVTVVFNLFGYSFMAMVPVIGERVFAANGFEIGVLQAAEGLTAFLAALVIAWRARPQHFALLYAAGSTVFILCVLIFSFAERYEHAFAILLLSGFAMAGFATMQSGLVLAFAEPAMRSRAMGIVSLSIGAAPIGFVVIGELADHFGALVAVRIMAALGLVAMLFVFLRWPALRRAQAPGR